MHSHFRIAVLLIMGLFIPAGLIPDTATAQVTPAGFVRNYHAIQTTPGHEVLVGRNRLRLDLSLPFGSTPGEVIISNDLQNSYAAEIDSLSYRLREAYLDLYFENSDLRIGRQIIGWGRAEGTRIHDIFTPLDLSEFLTQDIGDIQMGVTAIKYTRYFGSNYLQLVVNPVFNPNRVPEPGQRWFPREYYGTAFPVEFAEADSRPLLRDLQLGGRLALRSDLEFDLDLGYLFWRHPMPAYAKDLVTAPSDEPVFVLQEAFTRSHVLFYSGTVKLTGNLLFTSEGAFFTSRYFDYFTGDIRNLDYGNLTPQEQALVVQRFQENTDGFLVKRPWLNGMAGLQYDWKSWTVSGQVIDEFILNHDGRFLPERHFTSATLRLQRSFLRDKWTIRGFGRYHFNGRDFWMHPEIIYEGIDNFQASAGAQLFGGREPPDLYGHLSFDFYERNSFFYLRLTGYF